MGYRPTSPHIATHLGTKLLQKRFVLPKQRQAQRSSKVTFVADSFRYQVLYFAVRGKITLVKRAAQRLSTSVEEAVGRFKSSW